MFAVATDTGTHHKEENSMQSTDQGTDPQPQLLSLGRNDATRLLEVYVKRSLSLNDGPARGWKPGAKPHKWVTLAEKKRRHSSDSSAHLWPDEVEAVIISGFEPAHTDYPMDTPTDAPKDAPMDSPKEKPRASHLENSTEQEQDRKPPKKGAKKSKKPSLIKSFLNLFSRKGSEKKEERKSSSPERVGSLTPPDTPSPSISCLPVPGPSSGSNQASPQARRSLRRRNTRRRFSFRNRGADEAKSRPQNKPTTLALSKTVHIPDAVSVEPTSVYYEKVSEELEKIVKEVKDSPTDEGHKIFGQRPETLSTVTTKEAEVIERIINLIKQQGDAIDEKLKLNENSNISSFFQRLSYGSFQQLADLYVETGTPSQLHEGTVTAPELVKFAFTLDFTAKVAGLSSQTVGRIMGFGNQYLQDRFTQMSVAYTPEFQSKQAQNFSGPD
ncbi:hypothetical protein AAFF_G00409890 [Aldrovandia affinis]|uniref:Apoptosis facilitator Bcl-2-like protein 14 n=1 Tax=Aldrovandia affinis TaxID=143900 RepID=A0AAD7SC41_9TELE|nr:hypothetical protein AAFF_G00409890 [Aldrovandia affinis]